MRRRHAIAAFLILALGLPAAAGADDPERETSRVVIVGDDDESVILSLEGRELTITTEDGDHTSVRMVDMAQIGHLVGQAMEDLDTHLEVLHDLQLDMHMGQDNRLNMSWEDRTLEVDVDAIMAQVSAAISAGMDEFDRDDWTELRDRDRTTEELREELADLKAELRELRRELRKLEDD